MRSLISDSRSLLNVGENIVSANCCGWLLIVSNCISSVGAIIESIWFVLL
jgi:hypothetical protein